ncbi:MAG: SpoIIE family protein phosphatase [Clostridia bacterium]|nr:SpoIIE family protein phosphatase [Clostridia bacterium]
MKIVKKLSALAGVTALCAILLLSLCVCVSANQSDVVSEVAAESAESDAAVSAPMLGKATPWPDTEDKDDMEEVFSKLIGTLAIILLVAAFVGGSDILSRLNAKNKRWVYYIIAGVLGGIFGIYGNLSGFDMNGAIISVRDMGPMLAGFVGGPVGGLVAGLIAGLHRLMLGGITATACVVATGCIGLICGLVSLKWYKYVKKPYNAFLLGAVMEAFHLGVVLLMVRPFETALDIVKSIALPFILVNAVGFMLMVSIIAYTERQRMLMMEKSRMQSELEVANVIQHSLLPTINETYPACAKVDVRALMEAAKEVGGDFYDVFFVDGNHLAFMVGDVSGKGVPAALFMANAKITLQNCIRDIPQLSEAIQTANNALCAGNDAEMFVTLWVGVLDLQSGELTYVSAGHNPPVVIQNGKPDYVRQKSGFVLAGMENMRYKEYTITLQKGDYVFLYTDGVTEANNADGELFGEERLIRCFDGLGDVSADQVLNTVKRAVDGFVQDNDPFDDLTMMCFRYLG